jgi:hypothetical protein
MAKILNINGTNYNQYFTQILDNQEYVVHIYYNTRSGWYISFYDPDIYESSSVDNTEALIYGGRKLVPNQEILLRVIDDRLPQGSLFCYDTNLRETSKQSSIVLDNFGSNKRYQVIYFTEEEVAELL